jgi:DNA recombination protein RmuC
MSGSDFLPILFLAIGLLTGGLLSWLGFQLFHSKKFISRSELEAQYVPRSAEQLLRESLLAAEGKVEAKERELRVVSADLASKSQLLRTQEESLRSLQEQNRLEFENLANRLLEEKSEKFGRMNMEKIGDVLTPLKEQIQLFSRRVEDQSLLDTRDRVLLKAEIERLRELNQQLSADANNLARALKGDSKVQGDWGEMQLELLLEKVGLIKGMHFQVQSSFADAAGKQKRPDFVVQLPGQKHLVIDAKVSLKAYDLYCQTETPEAQKGHLKAHLDSIRQHIRELGSKNYQQLYQISQPDYVLLFVPIEPALNLAVQHDNQLFMEALEKNIVIVSGSTLLATMRTVAYIWTQEKQQRNVQEIARQSGALYDKFVAFVEDMREIGTRMEQLEKSYESAMYKLFDGKRRSDTLIGRAERVRELGAGNSKELPPEFRPED